MLRGGTIVLLAMLTAAAGALHKPWPVMDKLDMVPVAIEGRMLNVSRFEVTIAQWNACVAENACPDIAHKVEAAESTPMTGVNWFDVEAYVAWASTRHGTGLRLPTADEWRDFSRLPEPALKPRYDDPRLAWAANYGQEETPGGPVRPQNHASHTPEGLGDIAGNVWEWTSSCASSRPGDTDKDHCPAMKVMGAHTAIVSVFVRNPASGGCSMGKPPTHLGFRLVQEGTLD